MNEPAAKPPNNDRFLDAIFGRSNPGVFTASFRGPMSEAQWGRNPFCSDPAGNNYYCVSTLSDPNGRRTPDNCAALHVLLVDDIGTKVEPERASGVLGEPTYRIETSQGNEQWGYLLDPPDADPSHAESLVRAMVRIFTADAAGRNRVARLPYGTNGKNGFKTRLLAWKPDCRLSPEQAYLALEATPVEAADLTHPGALPIDQDPTIAAMEAQSHPFEATSVAGIYKVQCPWVAEHSDGRDDGAAYISPAGFNCFHGHCADKTFAHFRSFLGLSAPDVDGAIADHEFGAKSVPVPAEPSDAGVGVDVQVDSHKESETRPQHPWLTETAAEFAHSSGRILTREEVQAVFPIEWLFDGVVPMNIPWCIAGEGGLGKSRIMLSLCMAVACGRRFGNEFVPGNKGGAPVVFLTQEDDKPSRAHRFVTQYEYLCERDAGWRSDEVVERLKRNLYMPSLEWGQQLSSKFKLQFKEFLDALPAPPALVVFDPLVLFWDHTDKESSITSAAGAVSTMRTLIQMVRNKSKHPFSVAICHHLSKVGEVYGSAILTANLRLVFNVTRQEGARTLDMKVLKVNGSDIKDKVYAIDLADETAAVYPSIPFEGESPEQKLAALIHSGRIAWDVPASKLIAAAMKTGEFSGADVLAAIVTPDGVWHKDTSGSAERLAELGLRHMNHNRYAPIAGFSGE